MSTPVTAEDWAAHRQEALIEDGKGLVETYGAKGVLLPYQQELVRSVRANRMTVTDKSRRVGATWGIAAEAVLTSAAARSAGGMDTLYLGYNMDMAREFVDTCAMWARAFNTAVSSVKEFLFTEEGEKGADKAIQAFRISFRSGFEIVALSSKPRSLRGRQGFVILDEFAFHDEAEQLLKAAVALMIWGGKVLVISTHNGIDNPFNKLIEAIRAGKRPGNVVRVTFDDALRQGLYKRICLKAGEEWSAEKEAKWRADIRAEYQDGAAEELDCIPSQGSGVYLTRALIEARMKADIPAIRWKSPPGFVDWPERRRIAEIEDFCQTVLAPLLTGLNPLNRSCFGVDFGRSGDLTVIHPMQITRFLSRTTPFVLELRDVPFEAQKQILFFIADRLPRFGHGGLDASGNGWYLAEVARQRYGVSLISEIKLSDGWYIQNMPKLKAAFEDGTIELPLDDDIATDYRGLVMTNGVAKIPSTVRTKGRDGFTRHGDTAIAGALAVFASGQDTGVVRMDTLGIPRETAALASSFLGAADVNDQLRNFGGSAQDTRIDDIEDAGFHSSDELYTFRNF